MIDLTGQRFGRLVVMQGEGGGVSGHIIWLCKCDCGSKTSVPSNHLRSGHTNSCGCLVTKHGHNKKGEVSKTYQSWQSMVQRCTNPNNKDYYNYGGRGIKVCESWLEFENFLEDMGEAPKGYQIDRVDNNGNYCKPNCRWATRTEQARNMRTNHLKTYKNKTQCISAWAEEFDINYSTLYSRIFTYNWSLEKALITPVRKKVR